MSSLLFSPQVTKLYSIKSEVRYSPGMILFKLVSSFTISQVTGMHHATHTCSMYIHVHVHSICVHTVHVHSICVHTCTCTFNMCTYMYNVYMHSICVHTCTYSFTMYMYCTLNMCTYIHLHSICVHTCTLNMCTYIHVHSICVHTCTLNMCTYIQYMCIATAECVSAGRSADFRHQEVQDGEGTM